MLKRFLVFANIPPLRGVFSRLQPAFPSAHHVANHTPLTPLKGGISVVFLLALFMRTTPVFAGSDDQPQFAVAKMPVQLGLNADAVVRLDSQTFFVESPKRATEQVRNAVTIFNAKGRESGTCLVFYDRLRELKSLRGWLLDDEGRKIRELKDRDVKDYSAISGYSLYEDSRARVAELYHDAYPYTVVFEYERIYNGLINWPIWYPQAGENPVEHSWFELHVPADMPVRYRLRGRVNEPKVRASASRKIYRWEAAMIPKYEHEPHGPSWREQAASVLTAPQEFEIAGYAGNMSSWEAFGSWFQRLSAGRDVLPSEALAQVQQSCSNLTSPTDKARVLYEKLQNTTRYVSVQLGVGGWQPFDADYVFTRGYGDCKALSNYMVAMLKAVEVNAYPVLIQLGADEPEVLADFPNNQFNHVIACVPLEQDTLWLECTNQVIPFGHLGMSTEGRNALIVTPSGGKLVRTPKSKAKDNQQARRALVTLNEIGDGRVEVRTRYTGNQQDRVRQALAQKSPQEREDWLRREIDIPSFRLLKADFAEVESKLKEITLPVSLELPRFASRSGTRLFLKPNLMERWKHVPPALKERTQPVDLSYAYIDLDSVSYQLPPNYAVEAAPLPTKIETSFGIYHAAAEFKGESKLEYVRRLEMRESKLPAEQYEAYRKFIAEIVKADGMQVVLVRKNN